MPETFDKADAAPGTPLTIAQYRRMFDASRTDMADGRKDSELSRDYVDGFQLTAAEKAILEARGQPPIQNNRILRAVNGILGIVAGSKTDPRALMRNPPDDAPTAPAMAPQGQAGQGAAPDSPILDTEDAGDVATEVLRYIGDTTQFQATTKMDVLEDGIVEGCGSAIVEIDGRNEVSIIRGRWEEFFYDPKSRAHDFSDARWKGIAKWMYADDVAALYPDTKDKMTEFTGAQGSVTGMFGGDETWEDRPEARTPWVDGKQKRLMVVDMYHLIAGEWYRCVFYAGGVLESGPSAYKDDKGNSVCPIEGWSCYVNRKNERYGEVKMMRDIQDEINMRRSKSLHEINTRQLQVVDPNAPPFDVKQARDEAARPDGIIPTGLQVVPRSDVVQGNLELLAEAKGELERMAAAPAILGRQGADASGRSVQLRQQAGLTELARVLNRHAEWENRVYKQAWWRACQFWTDPKWIRVTNDQDAPKYIRINEPVAQPMLPPGHPAFGGQMAPQPQMKNHLAQMDVDIILESVPDTATLEQEQFNELAQLAQSYGSEAVPFVMMLELSTIVKKRGLMKKFKSLNDQNNQIGQMKIQGEMAKLQADIALIKSTIVKNDAQTGLMQTQTVTTALAGHMDATKAAQLPPGVVLDGSGSPQHAMPPPHPIPAQQGAMNGSSQPQ